MRHLNPYATGLRQPCRDMCQLRDWQACHTKQSGSDGNRRMTNRSSDHEISIEQWTQVGPLVRSKCGHDQLSRVLQSIERGQSGTQESKQAREPEELSSEAFHVLSRGIPGLEQRQQQLQQTLLLVFLHADSKSGKINAPPNPNRESGQIGLMPRHGHLQNKEKDNDEGRQKRRCAFTQ